MYEQYFGLKERPFSIAPDPAYLYLTPKHRRALAMLEYGLSNQVGFAVVTGAIGSGKTMLLRKLLQRVGDQLTVGTVNNTQCEDFAELMRWILVAFGIDYEGHDKVDMIRRLEAFLSEQMELERRAVLIIDEAQHLSPETLEQLRLLSNFTQGEAQLLQIILVGQPSLRELLRRPELEQFAQRICVDYALDPLSPGEVEGYVRHRMSVAGGNPRIFQPETFDLIWRATRGVPRLVNLLCDMALVYGFADQRDCVDRRLIGAVVRDRASGLAPMAMQLSRDNEVALEHGSAQRPAALDGTRAAH